MYTLFKSKLAINVPWEPMVYHDEVSKLGDESFDASLPIFEDDWIFQVGIIADCPRAETSVAVV